MAEYSTELLGDYNYGDLGNFDAGLGNIAPGGNFNTGSNNFSLSDMPYNDMASYDVQDNFDYTDPAVSEYGSGYGPSYGVYANPAHPNTTSFQQFLDETNNFFNTKPGRVVGALASFSPVGRALQLGRGLANMLGKGDILGAGGALASSYGGLPGNILNVGLQASRGNLAPGIGLAGSMAGGPAGGILAGELARNFQNSGQSTGNTEQSTGGFNPEGTVNALGQLFAATQANKGLSGVSANNAAVSQQIQALSNMFSPSSPYAQQLRQTLERKDAAAGRRSQYGPREAQLMAALAEKQAGAAETMGRLATSSQNNQLALNTRSNQTRAQRLALAAKLAKESGLFDLFRRDNSNPGGTPPISPSGTQLPLDTESAQYDVPDNYNWNQYVNTDSLYGG